MTYTYWHIVIDHDGSHDEAASMGIDVFKSNQNNSADHIQWLIRTPTLLIFRVDWSPSLLWIQWRQDGTR